MNIKDISNPIVIEKSEADSRSLIMPHQQEAVEAMTKYFILGEDKADRNGIVVMPTGERVIIVMGAVNVMKPRVSGTLNKYILCIA